MNSVRKTKLQAKLQTKQNQKTSKPTAALKNATRSQSIVLGASPKPRNPVAPLASQRKAGSHTKPAKAQRRADTVALKTTQYR